MSYGVDMPSQSSMKQSRRDERLRKIRAIKSNVGLWLHGVFWGTLFFFRVGWAYSKLLCRLGLYQKRMDGACMYCGKSHE